jgi:hypothetical protein
MGDPNRPADPQAEFPECGSDFVCYYDQKARQAEQFQQNQQEDLDLYRNQQMELGQQQIEELQSQNSILESQLEELNQRQQAMEEQQQKLIETNQELLEIQKEQKKSANPKANNRSKKNSTVPK